MNEDLHLICDCGTHSLQMHREGDDLEVSLWKMAGERPLRWREKLRWCWRILRTGMPWVDFVILNPQKKAALETWLRSEKVDTSPSDYSLIVQAIRGPDDRPPWHWTNEPPPGLRDK